MMLPSTVLPKPFPCYNFVVLHKNVAPTNTNILQNHEVISWHAFSDISDIMTDWAIDAAVTDRVRRAWHDAGHSAGMMVSNDTAVQKYQLNKFKEV